MSAAEPRPIVRPIIRISGVSKVFGRNTVAVDDVDLEIREGEFFALLGPSGCGKTTLLRMLAGFETVSSGQITLDGQDMRAVPPNRRPVNMVFQSYAVFPHMSVLDNVAYGLRVDGVRRTEREQRARDALALVRLGDFATRKPDQLSGGQRQRVALARALVKRPRVLLLDEPLSALDAKLRESMQMELVQLQHRVGITFVVVTHDQDEALSMADRIAVMDSGRVRQLAAPDALYEHPNCRFVADFIGQINVFEGTLESIEANQVACSAADIGALQLPRSALTADNGDPCEAGQPVAVAVRPEKLQLSQQPPTDGQLGVQAEVSGVAYHGAQSLVHLRTASGVTLMANVANSQRGAAVAPSASEGATCWALWRPADTLLLTQ